MKKKILVVNHQMQLGGVCIAAKNFIVNMKDDYDIEYMLAKSNGELDNRLPEEIKISYIPYPLCVASMTKAECKSRGLKYFLKKARIVLASKMFGYLKTADKLCKKTQKNTEKYDIVINNDMDVMPFSVGACHLYTKNLVDAKMKVLVIHGDFVKNGYDIELFRKELLPVYDHIVLMSEELKNQIAGIYPEAKDKFVIISNFAAVDEIKSMANEINIENDSSKINIVSASRLTEVKGFMRSLNAFKKLKNEGFDFCWQIIGDGEQREMIQDFVKNNGLEENVKLLGLKNNPYPYIKAADLLYLGSYHEAYGLVLVESMIVGNPVLTTNTASASEIVEPKYGWICDNDEEGIYNALKQILSDKKLIEEKKKNLENYEFDNASIKKKYDKLFEKVK